MKGNSRFNELCGPGPEVHCRYNHIHEHMFVWVFFLLFFTSQLFQYLKGLTFNSSLQRKESFEMP